MKLAQLPVFLNAANKGEKKLLFCRQEGRILNVSDRLIICVYGRKFHIILSVSRILCPIKDLSKRSLKYISLYFFFGVNIFPGHLFLYTVIECSYTLLC
jgi:hypothetical protein